MRASAAGGGKSRMSELSGAGGGRGGGEGAATGRWVAGGAVGGATCVAVGAAGTGDGVGAPPQPPRSSRPPSSHRPGLRLMAALYHVLQRMLSDASLRGVPSALAQNGPGVYLERRE